MIWVTGNEDALQSEGCEAPEIVPTWAPPASDILSEGCGSRNYSSGPDGHGVINDSSDIIDCVASIVIRNLEESTKRKLKVRAAQNGRSMEQEAREILNKALTQPSQKPETGADLVRAIRARFEPLGGVELELPPRQPMRDPDWLKDWE